MDSVEWRRPHLFVRITEMPLVAGGGRPGGATTAVPGQDDRGGREGVERGSGEGCI